MSFPQDVNTMASFCQTITTSALTSDVISVTSPGMTSMVTSSLSKCPWNVLVEVPPTITNLIPTTHVERLVISAEPQVRFLVQLTPYDHKYIVLGNINLSGMAHIVCSVENYTISMG